MPRIKQRNRKKTPESIKFYASKVWRRVRSIVLNENPYCLICKKKGITTLADTVDHIKPIEPNATLSEKLDRSNLRSLCKRCHDALNHTPRNILPPRTFPDGRPNPAFREVWDLYHSQE